MSPRLAAVIVVSACAAAPIDEGAEDDGTDERACPGMRSLAAHCGALLDEPVYVTLLEKSAAQPHEIGLLGGESGNTCSLTKFPQTNIIDHVATLGVLGTDVFYCASPTHDAPGPLTRVSMVDGAVRTTDVFCLSVVSFDDKLIVKTDATSNVKVFDNFDALVANKSTTLSIGESALRLGAGEDKLYSTLPTPDKIFVYDFAASASSQLAMSGTTIAGVTGIASQRGVINIIDGQASDQWMYAFDAKTGASQGRVVAATQVTRVHGLSNACKLPAFE